MEARLLNVPNTSGRSGFALDHSGQHRVTAGAGPIHRSTAHVSVLGSFQDQSQHVILTRNDFLVQTFYENSPVNVLADLQVDLARIKQVQDLLVVDLKEAALDEVFESRTIASVLDQLLLFLHALKDVFKGSLHDATAFVLAALHTRVSFLVNADEAGLDLQTGSLNSERLSSARLTIRKNGAIVALQAGVGDRFGNLVEYSLLVN